MPTQTENTPITTGDIPEQLADLRAAAVEEYDQLDDAAYARRAALIGERRAYERALQLVDAAQLGLPADQLRPAQEILADVAAERHYGDDHHPTIEEEHPVGSHQIVLHAFERREMARGKVVGYRDGAIDTGGPESGPGEIVETTLIVLQLDGGGEVTAVDAGRLEPEEEER